MSSDDFFVDKGENGNILSNKIKGFSLILFYSTQCEHCKNLIPIFKKLPGSIGGCQFGMVNVSTNKMCVNMSKDTISPILYVPLIILYINGVPVMRYNGPHEDAVLRRFVMEVAQKFQSKQQFSAEEPKNKKKEIPAYCTGIPLCGKDDKVCYLEFDKAYVK